jgi:hypothetical protein
MLKFHFLFVLQFYFCYKLVFGRLLEESTIAQIDEIQPNRRNQYFVVKNAKITYSRRINPYEVVLYVILRNTVLKCHKIRVHSNKKNDKLLIEANIFSRLGLSVQ